jgi:hypothetical protein
MSRTPALIAALLLAPAFALSAVDVLLVEQPAALRILDRYQQTVERPSTVGIVPFVPMTIIQERQTLSDGFTPAVRVEIGGETFFLLGDGHGGLLRVGDPGAVRRLRSVVPVGDTISVQRAAGLRLQDPLRRTSSLLGGLVRREFRLGGETYVRLLDESGRYGWVTLGERGGRWQPYRSAAPVARGPLEGTETRVRELLSTTNAVLDSLYRFLNARTGASRRAPRWELERAQGELTCQLRGLADPGAMSESTAALARRIELAVSGSGVEVTQSPGTIRIRP